MQAQAWMHKETYEHQSIRWSVQRSMQKQLLIIIPDRNDGKVANTDDKTSEQISNIHKYASIN